MHLSVYIYQCITIQFVVCSMQTNFVEPFKVFEGNALF